MIGWVFSFIFFFNSSYIDLPPLPHLVPRRSSLYVVFMATFIALMLFFWLELFGDLAAGNMQVIFFLFGFYNFQGLGKVVAPNPCGRAYPFGVLVRYHFSDDFADSPGRVHTQTQTHSHSRIGFSCYRLIGFFRLQVCLFMRLDLGGSSPAGDLRTICRNA